MSQQPTVNNEAVFDAVQKLHRTLTSLNLGDMEKIITVETLTNYVHNVFSAKVAAISIQNSLKG